MGSLSESTYVATNNTSGNQTGTIGLDNTTVGGHMHVNIGQTIDMYAPSADVDYTDKIGFSGNYTFTALGGKGGNITATDSYAGTGTSNGGYGSAITNSQIDYATGQSITYRKGSNGKNYNCSNSTYWNHASQDNIMSLRLMGNNNGDFYGYHNHEFCAYYATAQVGTASYIQISGNKYIVAGGGAPGVICFSCTNGRYSVRPLTAMHADVTPALRSGYGFYNPGSPSMTKRYRDYTGTSFINAGRIAGTTVKTGVHVANCYGGYLAYEDIFYGWICPDGGGAAEVSAVYPGYSGLAARDGSKFNTYGLSNSTYSVSINSTIQQSTPFLQLKCNAKYITINNPTRDGYKFNGWTCGSGVSIVSSDNTKTKFKVTKSNATITAQWTPITYKIRFNGNNNWNTSQGSYTQVHTYDTPLALTDNKFTRADATTYNSIYYKRGYQFIGWGTSPTQKTPTYSNKQTVKNLTTTDGTVIDLYALWKKEITLTINFNGGKFNNNGTSKVLKYTMYNSESNHTFDITQYYGALSGSGYNSKGLNNNLTKIDRNGIQYRFLGYSLNPDATVPDTEFEIYAKDTRIENYNIKDNTTLYAVWEPVLQMTVQLSAPSNPGTIVLTDDVPVSTALGNFKILSGTKNTDLLSSGTASVNSATIGANVTNADSVTYTVNAKGASSIKFSTAADSRILDLYNHGKNNPWFDNLNEVKDFNYSINDFTSATSSFTIPQYLGTTQSYQTSNPDLASGTAVYGIMFTCTQPSYYYNKYWHSDESTSVYCILFLKATNPDGGNGLPPSAVEDGMYDFQTMLN